MHSNNQWLDPLYLDSFLNEDEKLIRENTKKYCQKNFPARWRYMDWVTREPDWAY